MAKKAVQGKPVAQPVQVEQPEQAGQELQEPEEQASHPLESHPIFKGEDRRPVEYASLPEQPRRPEFKIGRFKGVIYDLEIIKCVPGKAARDPKLQYCAGWNDYANMGIACICAFDCWEREIRVFTKGNFGDFIKLLTEREEVIGFNSRKFDDNVCKAYNLQVKSTYDIMEEAMIAAKTDKFIGMGLGNLCTENGVKFEKADGAQAPVNWQMGNYGAVIDYCIKDVMATYKMFLKLYQFRLPGHMNLTALREPVLIRKMRSDFELQQGPGVD